MCWLRKTTDQIRDLSIVCVVLFGGFCFLSGRNWQMERNIFFIGLQSKDEIRQMTKRQMIT